MSELHAEPVHRLRLWVIALVVFAAAVRVIGVDYDSHHFFHPDERRIAMAIDELSFKPLQLNPHFFSYGSFPLYLVRSVTSALGVLDPQLRHYDDVIITGRLVSALAGTLTVLLILLLGTRLYGKSIGLLPGFLLAAFAIHVPDSDNLPPTSPRVHGHAAALACLVRLVERGWTRDYAIATS
jgi:4-amino-4-deoxy-L-arabinose transferase-like glycosyltransferase